jgi:hypothetical protein
LYLSALGPSVANGSRPYLRRILRIFPAAYGFLIVTAIMNTEGNWALLASDLIADRCKQELLDRRKDEYGRSEVRREPPEVPFRDRRLLGNGPPQLIGFLRSSYHIGVTSFFSAARICL